MDLDSEASAFSLGEESDGYVPEPVSTTSALFHRKLSIMQSPSPQQRNQALADSCVLRDASLHLELPSLSPSLRNRESYISHYS
jgi:hypothetical protein